MPRLPLFPPFCISLSFPTDTALNAKNCGTSVRAVPGGQWGRSTYAGHNRVRQQSLERDTHDCESVSGRRGSVGVGIVRCDSSQVRSELREGAPRPPALAPPTSRSSDDLGQLNKHAHTRYRQTTIIHRVAQSRPFIRIANIEAPAAQAVAIIARRSNRPRPPFHSNDQRDCGAPSSPAGIALPRDTISRLKISS
jgi:hypothetical protein